MAGPRQVNLVSVLFYLGLAVGIYLSVQYVPIFLKKTELETIVKEASYAARRKQPEALREELIDQAQKKLRIALDPEEIVIDRLTDRVKIYAVWHVTVDHPFGYVTTHIFQIEQETLFF